MQHAPGLELQTYIELACHHLLIFFFNAPAPPEIYTLSLHDALPISGHRDRRPRDRARCPARPTGAGSLQGGPRSEEHTSELQSRRDLVCRLLLEKKNTIAQPSDGSFPRSTPTLT